MQIELTEMSVNDALLILEKNLDVSAAILTALGEDKDLAKTLLEISNKYFHIWKTIFVDKKELGKEHEEMNRLILNELLAENQKLKEKNFSLGNENNNLKLVLKKIKESAMTIKGVVDKYE